jgi:hypothetical protein
MLVTLTIVKVIGFGAKVDHGCLFGIKLPIQTLLENIIQTILTLTIIYYYEYS